MRRDELHAIDYFLQGKALFRASTSRELASKCSFSGVLVRYLLTTFTNWATVADSSHQETLSFSLVTSATPATYPA